MSDPYRDGLNSDALVRTSTRGRESSDDATPGIHLEVTTTADDVNDKVRLDVETTIVGGTKVNPLAKYVEATYTSGDTVVTYRYYESSSKVTLYNTIVVTYTTAQDTTFTSASWS